MTISKTILQRINDKNTRFFACDNVSEFILEGEKELLIDETAEKFEAVLRSLLIDVDNDPNSQDTARRLSKMYFNEIMSGRYLAPPDVTAFPNTDKNSYKGMLVVRSEIQSVCAHHHQPVWGVAYIGIIPTNKVIGLSKYSRIAQWCARRGTLKEELTNQIAQSIMAATESENVGVYIGASHGCCSFRGIQAKSSLTQTTVLNGLFKEIDVKKEFFDHIEIQEKRS